MRSRFAVAWVALGLAGAPAAFGQGEPRFKDGVTVAPAEAVKDAPFDVARFFDAPPRDKNAAPLYFDALLEFSPDVASLYPEGPEREQRRAVAQDRMARYQQLTRKDAEIDALLADHRVGFRKLAEAQKRERCMFQPGVGITALLPHVQDARQVVRVASLKARRELEKGDVSGAIADAKMMLRLSRDLQPRGYIISQLVAAAVNTVVVKEIVLPILNAPGLTVRQCDTLLAVLAEHEAKSIDAYAESLKAEYLSTRVTLVDLIKRQDSVAAALALKPGESIIDRMFNITTALAPGQVPPPNAPANPFPAGVDVDTELTKTTDAQLARVVTQLNAHYRALAAKVGKPRAEQIAGLPPDVFQIFAGSDMVTIVARELQPTTRAALAAIGRNEAICRLAECLAVVRRWQLTHKAASPTNLAAAFKAAGLDTVPVDPFDGKPMRLAKVDSEPVVYSVGKDGKDDGGKVDSDYDRKPGDLTMRLPTAKTGR